MDKLVAVIGRAHGLRGEVCIHLHTDQPEVRFAPGESLTTVPSEVGPLTIATVRPDRGRLFVTFVGVDDRNGADALRGVELHGAAFAETDAWYLDDLRGLRVVTTGGEDKGEVVGLVHGPAQDLLEVRDATSKICLVPLVAAIVTEVDIAGGMVVVDPPEGLFEL